MMLLELKSRVSAKRAETAKTLENVSSPNPSDYRYLQGHIHNCDWLLKEIDMLLKDVGDDD